MNTIEHLNTYHNLWTEEYAGVTPEVAHENDHASDGYFEHGHCDICNDVGDFTDLDDWNGETGNHLSCEQKEWKPILMGKAEVLANEGLCPHGKSGDCALCVVLDGIEAEMKKEKPMQAPYTPAEAQARDTALNELLNTINNIDPATLTPTEKVALYLTRVESIAREEHTTVIAMTTGGTMEAHKFGPCETCKSLTESFDKAILLLIPLARAEKDAQTEAALTLKRTQENVCIECGLFPVDNRKYSLDDGLGFMCAPCAGPNLLMDDGKPGSDWPVEASRDPVHEDDEGWWFYDETWADRSGPFETREDAQAALDVYVKEVLG